LILVDTSVWVDHFRTGDEQLRTLLGSLRIVVHPFVIAELALGSMTKRTTTLTLLDNLPAANVALLGEVRHLIERRSLHGRGIGLMDAHLIASALLTPGTLLWTRDKRLRSVAQELDIDAGLA
jgi:predicted nucleic acid-binding protein